MRSLSSRVRLGVLAGLLVLASAAPRSEAAATARAKVSFAPLFDTNARFKVRQSVKLRFRASETAHPLALADVSVSLRRDPRDGEMRLPVRRLKGGIFEVPFSPMWPGEYLLAITVRGASKGPVVQVPLGVVGVAPGLVEVPPEKDGEVLQQRRGAGRTSR
jgi:hypothetical protein